MEDLDGDFLDVDVGCLLEEALLLSLGMDSERFFGEDCLKKFERTMLY